MLMQHLNQADSHIAQSDRHITRQREIVAELQRHGHDAHSAIDLLKLFEQTHETHLAGRERLWDELSAAS